MKNLCLGFQLARKIQVPLYSPHWIFPQNFKVTLLFYRYFYLRIHEDMKSAYFIPVMTIMKDQKKKKNPHCMLPLVYLCMLLPQQCSKLIALSPNTFACYFAICFYVILLLFQKPLSSHSKGVTYTREFLDALTVTNIVCC